MTPTPITAAHAQRLILAANNRFGGGAHRFVIGGVDRYAEEHVREVKSIVDRATARTEVLAMFPNGLRKMRALDHHDEIVAEWVEGQK